MNHISISAWRRGVVALVVGAAPILLGAGLGQIAGADRPDKVTVCHRTASHSNPYVMIWVDQHAVDGDLGNDHGRGDHYMEHLGPIGPVAVGEWGDIIPAVAGVHEGRNWTSEGQAIFRNGCNPATPVLTTTSSPTSTTSPSSTTTAAAPTTTAAAATTTTTTAAAATTTTTTAAAATTTTTTAAPAPTTTTSALPAAQVLSETITQTPAATDAAAVDSTSSLAATGIGSRQVVLLGLVLLGAGSLFYGIRRRRS